MTAPNLEQIIAEHLIVVFFPSRLDGGVAMEWYVKCHCEWAEYAPTHAEAEQKFAAHVVAAIRDSGNTVIALPEANEHGEFLLPSIDRWSAIVLRRNDGKIGIDGVPTPLPSPSIALEVGAALIAAARLAGDTQ